MPKTAIRSCADELQSNAALHNRLSSHVVSKQLHTSPMSTMRSLVCSTEEQHLQPVTKLHTIEYNTLSTNRVDFLMNTA